MVTTFSVNYDQFTGEGTTPAIEEFTDKKEAMNFALDKRRHVDYTIEDDKNNYKEIDFGYINDSGEMISLKNY